MKTGSRTVLIGMLFIGLLAGSAWAKVDTRDDGAWLGIYTESVDYPTAERTDLPIEYGALITDVVSDSPADKAGLKENDIIVAVNGAKITDSDELSDAIAKENPGDKVEVQFYRGGKQMSLAVLLGSSSESQEEVRVPVRPKGNVYWLGKTEKQSYIGVTLTELTDQLRTYFGVGKGEGVLVGSVEKNSPADHAGLMAGDVLVAIDGRKVSSSDEVRNLIEDVKAGDKVSLAVIRNKNEMTLPVEVAQRDSGDVYAREFRSVVPVPPDVPDMQNLKRRMYVFDGRDSEDNFDSEEFQKQMDDLREQLKTLRAEVFDSEAFQKQMQQLKEQLKSLDLTVRDLEKKVK